MTRSVHIVVLSSTRWASMAARVAAGGVAAVVRDLRAALRRASGRGLGWRGAPPSSELLSGLRRAGVVLAWVGAPRDLSLAAVCALAAEGPLLLVFEGDAVSGALNTWLASVAALRLPTVRIALHGVAPCVRRGFAGDLSVTLNEPPPTRPLAVACGRCGARSHCVGPVAGAEVWPLPSAVSNQFDLVACAPPNNAAGRGALTVAAAQVARYATLRTSAGDRHFVCDNSGWTAEQLEQTLSRDGQAWLDTSVKPRLDDFSADLRPLQRLTPAQEHTPGRWRPAVWQARDDDLFAVEEALLRAHIDGLRGTVVDIGAGPIRYLRALAGRIAAGVVRYVAVEPDLAELLRMAAALPGALLSQGVGEFLPLRDASVDHALMLRSFNHLRDVEAAFAEVTRVARRGATLLVVDNVAFGLLRTRSQITRARQISLEQTPFEHFRNANAAEAVAAIEASGGWRITQVRAVIPGRANQWMVQAVRREDAGHRPAAGEG